MSNQTFTDEVRVASAIALQIADAGVDADDPDFTTLLESECDVVERLRRVLRASRFQEAQSKALGEMIAEMRERKGRLDRKADGLRGVALWAMTELGLRKVEAPDLTASITAGRPKVIIIDEAALPDDVCVFERKPSKAAIAAWLDEKPCPGAEMSNGGPSLTVRVR